MTTQKTEIQANIEESTDIKKPNESCTSSDEELLKKKLEELRKRDPFIYR
jgi:hypothetical protein